MTTEEREQIRLCILRYCLRPMRVGLIMANLRGEGFREVTRDQLLAEIKYLADPEKRLLRAEDKIISPENKVWSTTSTGQDYLAEQGQEQT